MKKYLLILLPVIGLCSCNAGKPIAHHNRGIIITKKDSAAKALNTRNFIIVRVDTIVYMMSQYLIDKSPTPTLLLKSLEGFDVDSAGTVTNQGQLITKVQINDKYFRGDIRHALKAVKVKKLKEVQVIDDYGDAAENTFKDPGPTKTLNFITNN